MPITFPSGVDDITKVNATSGSTLNITKPTGTSDGDWLIMFYFARNAGGVLTVPSGWTNLLYNDYLWSNGLYAKYIPSAAAETATSYACSTSAGSGRALGMCMRLVGGDQTTLLDVAGAISTSPNGVVSNIVPAVTTTKTNDELLSVCVLNTSGTVFSYFSPASGWTQLVQNEVATATATTNATIFNKTQVTPGNTGTATFPIAPQAGNSLGQMCGLKSAGVITANTNEILNIVLRG